MRVSNVSQINNNLIYANNKKFETKSNSEIFNYNSLPIAYPKEYYISFKSRPVRSKHLNKLEQGIEMLYKQNKGENLKYFSVHSYDLMSYLTPSRTHNEVLINLINNEIKQTPEPNINEELLSSLINNQIKQTIKRFKRMNKPDLVNIPTETAENLISRLKEKEILPKNLSECKSSLVIKFINSIAKEFLSSYELDDFAKDFLTNEFTRNISPKYKEQNISTFDEDLKSRMLKVLDSEIFKKYVDKMDKIEAQEATSISVEECAEDLYKDIIENQISPFDNPKLYDYLQKNDEKLTFLLEKMYGNIAKYYIDCFNEFNVDKKHQVLLINPMLASNIECFLDFIAQNKIDTTVLAPYELLQKFSENLGTETIYRGLYCQNPDELIENLKANGNRARMCEFDKAKTIEAINYYIKLEYPILTIWDNIKSKISGDFETEFLSASSIYDIAAAVPNTISDSKTSVVVIKTEVPTLSMIKQAGPFFRHMQKNSLGKDLYVDGVKYNYEKYASKIETFIPFILSTKNAEYIKDNSEKTFVWLDSLY